MFRIGNAGAMEAATVCSGGVGGVGVLAFEGGAVLSWDAWSRHGRTRLRPKRKVRGVKWLFAIQGYCMQVDP